MNSNLKSLLPLVGGLVALCFVGLAACGSPFDEEDVGYANHADIFYYEDAKVDLESARKNFVATQLTLAGQAPDETERAVKSASYPFSVAQRSFKNFGVNMDRWDIKDTLIGSKYESGSAGGGGVGGESSKPNQYLALYHGRGNTFVVNKVRAHLLRSIAQAIDEKLTMLDRTPNQADAEFQIQEIRSTIESVFREVDEEIRDAMSEGDDSTSSANVVIITNRYVVTASVGDGKVVAYDNQFDTTVVDHNQDSPGLNNVFGAKKSRQNQLFPHVDFVIREEAGYEYLLIQSPSIAQLTSRADSGISDRTLTVIISKQLDSYARHGLEQEIFKQSPISIMNMILSKLSWVDKMAHSDYSLIMVVLNPVLDEIR